ncbi:MAG TPA: enoyl-CoA hydratase-related protein [Jatrophihabitantaceae bacterium]|nr:enoyl-CoA hydratase-related protein [Jatrophihabitantaceae bacterium]
MTIHQRLADSGVLEIVLDIPPVNAVDIASLGELIQILDGIEERDEVRAVVLRSEGRGFVGGGDVKEVQQLPGHEGILGQARGSCAASVALHECAVPVIAAVHNYCIGLGVLLAGSCDVVLASEGTVFVLSEVDNGATGGAIQAIGLMPDKRLRTAMFTCEPVPAEELHGYGSILRIVPEDELAAAARTVAEKIASKPPRVVRAAKKAINGSVGRRIYELYRQELSYTYELNLTSDAHDARETFVSGERKGYLAATDVDGR